MPIPPDLEEPPGDPDIESPVEPAHDELPFAKLTWERFEKLCLRLAKRESDVEDARRFGERGQSQSGIDIYARKSEHLYVVYQCRRVAQLTAAGLRTAVDDFVDGAWAGKATEFVFCTSRTAVRVQLAEEVERQRQRLYEHEPPIRFTVWDAEELSDKLRRHADLVELFFGRAWLEAFLPTAARAGVEARLTEIQEGLSRVERATTERIRLFIFDWDPEEARKELAALAHEDPTLFERLEDRIGNPPDPVRVVNVVAERPEWLVGARPWRALAYVAEKSGEWSTATAAWQEVASTAADPFERAGLLVAAAVTAGVAGDQSQHDALLGEARDLAPDHPRVRVQEVDQSLGGPERLAALEGVESDDPPIAALIACQRALAYLLLGDVPEARRCLAQAQQQNPRSAIVRMVNVNVSVQQARLDSSAHRRLDYPELKRALEEATSILDELRSERRFEETVRILMLAADMLSLIDERKKAREILMSAQPEELATGDAAEVLGDAAVRALGWDEALTLTDGAPSTPTIERIRASARAEIGSPRDREEAMATLDRLVSEGGSEAPFAALFRLGLVTDRRPAPWSDEAAEVLRREGYEAPASVAQAFLLDRVNGEPAAAAELLERHGNESWALLAKLRLAGMRNNHRVMSATASALLNLGPAQDVVIEAARAMALTGDRDRARQLLMSVGHDQACPPAVRADAYAHLIPLVADEADWEAAHRLHQEWTDVRPTDDRAFPWAPRIANRRR